MPLLSELSPQGGSWGHRGLTGAPGVPPVHFAFSPAPSAWLSAPGLPTTKLPSLLLLRAVLTTPEEVDSGLLASVTPGLLHRVLETAPK